MRGIIISTERQVTSAHSVFSRLPTCSSPELTSTVDREGLPSKSFLLAVASLDSFASMLCAREYRLDLVWSVDTRWANMAALFAAGFLCIGHCLEEERESKPADFDTNMPSVNSTHILLPKLHLMRCYIRPADVQHTRKTHRKAKRCRVTINQNLDRIVRECQQFHVAKHGVCWLYGNYVAALSGGQAPGPVRSLSVEIWQDQELVAGELGILLGRLYISLTGFYRKAGCGNVQLVVLSRLLHKAGVERWDLGMGMDYKAGLGSCLIPRAEHISITRSHRHFNETNSRLTELESMSGSSCERIMEWLPRVSPSQTN